ncbi:MAG: amidase [Bacillota bacterium]
MTNSTFSTVAAALRSGQLDLEQYISALCDRIDRIDPQLQAFLPEGGRRMRLLNEAGELKKRYPDPATRPLLFGIPVGVKDIFSVDGFPTKAGSQLPSELFTAPEAASVTALRNAGALIVGKTVSTEFAFAEPGPTRNPVNPDHTPGGSSSGSAAAVAAELSLLTLGTQTIGSVIRPAAFCGVVGVKPSYDRIMTQGLVYFSVSVDTVGYFTPDVAGARAAASIICSNWRSNPPHLDANRLPVIGVPEGPYLQQASPEALTAFEGQLSRLVAAGYTVKRVPALQEIEAINHRHRRLVFAEVAEVHHDWFPKYRSLYRPRTVDAIVQGQSVGREELVQAKASCLKLRAELEQQMAAGGIDLWACPPAVGPAPEGLDSTGDPIMNLPWTHAGMPAVSLPAGLAQNGLPLGLQLIACFNMDEYLLTWAEPMETVLRPRP